MGEGFVTAIRRVPAETSITGRNVVALFALLNGAASERFDLFTLRSRGEECVHPADQCPLHQPYNC